MGTDDKELESKDNEEPPDFVANGITSDISSSLCLIGEIDPHTFQVLIDNINTHNFIKPVLAKQLGLAIQSTTNF